jgi:Big-like domain-containing protein
MHRCSRVSIGFRAGVCRMGAIVLCFFGAATLVQCGAGISVPETHILPLDSAIHAVFVDPATITIQVGSTVTVTATVDRGPGAPNLGVTWASSDETVVHIDEHGTLTAIRPGAATVTAASIANPTFTGSAKVLVGAKGSAAPTL